MSQSNNAANKGQPLERLKIGSLQVQACSTKPSGQSLMKQASESEHGGHCLLLALQVEATKLQTESNNVRMVMATTLPKVGNHLVEKHLEAGHSVKASGQ